jgi:hypothetical protein
MVFNVFPTNPASSWLLQYDVYTHPSPRLLPLAAPSSASTVRAPSLDLKVFCITFVG